MLVESSLNPALVGDNGGAIGVLQMHKAYVQDAAEFAGEDWVHEDCLEPEIAVEIFRAYMARYATKKRLGRKPTLQDIARIHNGGPNGYKKDSTLRYWRIVKNKYAAIRKNNYIRS